MLLCSSEYAKTAEYREPGSLTSTLQLLHQWEAPMRFLGGIYGRLSAKRFFFFDGHHVHPPLSFSVD